MWKIREIIQNVYVLWRFDEFLSLFFSFQMKGHRPNSNTLAIPVPDKEPAGRRSSGLAHLMSALHQNAAAVVNSKTQLNGPDQV